MNPADTSNLIAYAALLQSMHIAPAVELMDEIAARVAAVMA